MFAKKAKAKYAADPTKKSMIFKLRAGETPDAIYISSSYDDGSLENVKLLPPFEQSYIIRGEDKNIVLVKNDEEAEILKYVESQPCTLSSLGLKIDPLLFKELFGIVRPEMAESRVKKTGIGGNVLQKLTDITIVGHVASSLTRDS